MMFTEYLNSFKCKVNSFFEAEAQCYDSGVDSQLLLYTDIENKDISASVKQKLIASKDMAFMSQFLARIERNAPLGIDLADIEYKGFVNHALTELFTKLEFFNFIKRLDLSSQEEAVEYKEGFDLALLDKNKVYAVDIENSSVSVVGDGVAVKADISDAEVFLANKDYKKVFLDSKKVYSDFAREGRTVDGIVFDVTLGAYLADSNMGHYDIEHLTSSFLNTIYEEGKTDRAQTVFKLYTLLEKNVAEAGMTALLTEVEMPLAKTLSNMERRGFRIERDALARYGEVLSGIAEELTGRIYFAAGCEFNINSPKQVAEVLFDKLELKSKKKKSPLPYPFPRVTRPTTPTPPATVLNATLISPIPRQWRGTTIRSGDS